MEENMPLSMRTIFLIVPVCGIYLSPMLFRFDTLVEFYVLWVFIVNQLACYFEVFYGEKFEMATNIVIQGCVILFIIFTTDSSTPIATLLTWCASEVIAEYTKTYHSAILEFSYSIIRTIFIITIYASIFD